MSSGPGQEPGKKYAGPTELGILVAAIMAGRERAAIATLASFAGESLYRVRQIMVTGAELVSDELERRHKLNG